MRSVLITVLLCLAILAGSMLTIILMLSTAWVAGACGI
jgi:hypothetical protein